MALLTVVYDACVLYPAPLRDLLMQLAVADVIRARWTDQIHEEWIGNLLKQRPKLQREKREFSLISTVLTRLDVMPVRQEVVSLDPEPNSGPRSPSSSAAPNDSRPR